MHPVRLGPPVTAHLILLHPHVPQCRRRSGPQGTLGNVWMHFSSARPGCYWHPVGAAWAAARHPCAQGEPITVLSVLVGPPCPLLSACTHSACLFLLVPPAWPWAGAGMCTWQSPTFWGSLSQGCRYANRAHCDKRAPHYLEDPEQGLGPQSVRLDLGGGSHLALSGQNLMLQHPKKTFLENFPWHAFNSENRSPSWWRGGWCPRSAGVPGCLALTSRWSRRPEPVPPWVLKPRLWPQDPVTVLHISSFCYVVTWV